jgi:hypothetical protein
MDVPTRTYRVEEANLALPEVRRLTARVVEVSGQLPELEDEVRIAEYRARRPGAAAVDEERLGQASERLQAVENQLVGDVNSLERMDLQLKDARTGLVDFLSYRHGELIELCWKLGEEEVAHWHRIGEGYAGRKPL